LEQAGSWLFTRIPIRISTLRFRVKLVLATTSSEIQIRGVRFIATSQNIDTDESNPAARFLLHMLMAAAEFEIELIGERTLAGQQRYRADYDTGKVGKVVHSRSCRNLPPHRPRKLFDRDEVVLLRHQGRSYRQIANALGLGVGNVGRALQARSKSS
jgi:DNA invertase Pin-like site-specific DNA recombinase